MRRFFCPLTGNIFDGDTTLDEYTRNSESRIQKKFEEFHAENPHIYETLVRMARAKRRAGHEVYGISPLWETIRWEGDGSVKTNTPYKLCNDYRSRYARLIMEQEEDLTGFFELRDLREVCFFLEVS